MKKLKIGSIQLNSVFSDQHYLPLSIGMLVSYAKKYLKRQENYEFQIPICEYIDPKLAAHRLASCDLVVGSVYVWNEQNTLAICEEYKKLNPSGRVVLGGPQIPNGQKQFRRKRTKDLTQLEKDAARYRFTEDYHVAYPFVDMLVHGEGERVFLKLLESFGEDNFKNIEEIPSISYVLEDRFYFNQLIPRMNDEELSQCPSPFLSGFFDELMSENLDRNWIVMYETDRGCPYQCTYCDWGGATEDKVSKFPMSQIQKDIEWMGEKRIPYVFLCNANFGILQRDCEIAKYFVECKKRFKALEGVSTQNAKNPKGHTLLALETLDQGGLNKATVMSQQSLNPETLKAVRRDNMDLSEYDEIQRKLAAQGIFTMTDIIFPMPNETYESIKDAIETLITNGQFNRIQFNNLSVLINTEMGNPEYQSKYGFNLIKSELINGHGQKSIANGSLPEYQTLVVGTNSMPPIDWVETRVYCWAVNFLFFNKLLQYPMILINDQFNIPYRRLIEEFISSDPSSRPIMSRIVEFFKNKAVGIQTGKDGEFEYSEKYLNIYWPPEELAHIEMCAAGELNDFYKESVQLFGEILGCGLTMEVNNLLQESALISNLLVRLPFEGDDVEVDITHNIPQYVKSIILGNKTKLQAGNYKIKVIRAGTQLQGWSEWAKRVIWFGNRRGAYLYDFECIEV